MLGIFLFMGLIACQNTTTPNAPSVSTASSSAPQNAQPDILLIVLNDTRRDALGAYGNDLSTSPYFDQLAAEGMLYMDAWSPASWTWPSQASIFTGLYPWEHGAHFTDQEQAAIKLEPDPLLASSYVEGTKTLAMELNAIGYETVSISSNRLIGPDFPLIGGFSSSSVKTDDAEVWAAVQQVLSQNREKPLFLSVNLASAQIPWQTNDVPWLKKYSNELDPQSSPPWVKEYLLPDGNGIHPQLLHKDSNMIFRHISGKETLISPQLQLLKSMYLGEVSRADHFLGLITTAWKKQHPNPKIIVTSDHGEYFGEHQLLNHGRSLHPEVLHVPLLVLGAEKGQNDSVVSTKDVFCQVLSFAGTPQTNCGLQQENTEVYAGAWVDVYWAKELGDRFTKSYRASISKENFTLVDSNNDCLMTQRKTKLSSRCIRHNLQPLFEGKTGQRAEPDPKARKALQKLGHISIVNTP